MAQPVVVQQETKNGVERQTAEVMLRIPREAVTGSKGPNTRKRKLLAQRSQSDSVHKDVRHVPGSCEQQATQPRSSLIVATNLIQNHVGEEEIIRTLHQTIDASQRIQTQEVGVMGSTGSTSGEKMQLLPTPRLDFIHKDTGNIIGSCEKQPEVARQEEEQHEQEFAQQKREEDQNKQEDWCHRLEEIANNSSEELSAINVKLDFLLGAFEKISKNEKEQRRHEEEQHKHEEELRKHEEGQCRLEEMVQKNREENGGAQKDKTHLVIDSKRTNEAITMQGKA
ncbi:hypothetical protein RJ641_020697 [Dillenia turbinata]|uniref:Uncharacterized protein n=1 Tax=Dillenia turbinata TaxID=194707 RepID=A0AAN8UHH1_9MAGN